MPFFQGERVAELLLHHARANECQDVQQFKREMAQLVEDALSSTLALGKVATGCWDPVFFFVLLLMHVNGHEMRKLAVFNRASLRYSSVLSVFSNAPPVADQCHVRLFVT